MKKIFALIFLFSSLFCLHSEDLNDLLSREDIYFADKAINFDYKFYISHPTHHVFTLSYRYNFITLGSGIAAITPAFNSKDNFYGPEYTYISSYRDTEYTAKDWTLLNPGISHVPIMVDIATSRFRNKLSLSLSGVYLYPIKELIYKPNFDILGSPKPDDPYNETVQEKRYTTSPHYLLITPKVKFYIGKSIFTELGVSFRTGSGNIDKAHDELYIRPYLSAGYSINFINKKEILKNYESIANIYFDDNEFDKALDYYEKAGKKEENYKRVKLAHADYLFASSQKIKDAEPLLAAGHLLKAADYYDIAQKEEKKIESLRIAAECYMQEGSLAYYLAMGIGAGLADGNTSNFPNPVSLYKKAAELYESIGDSEKAEEARIRMKESETAREAGKSLMNATELLEQAMNEKIQELDELEKILTQ